MNNRLRNGLVVALLGLILILAGAGVFYLYLTRNLAPAPSSNQVIIPTERILVAARDLPLGTQIVDGDFKEIEVPVQILPRDYITDPALVINRILTVPLVAGEFLLEHQLANPTDWSHDIPYVLAADKVLMAFSPSDLMMNLGIVQKGDVVDILVTMPIQTSSPRVELTTPVDAAPSETRTFTFNAMQKITIEALVLDEETRTGAQAENQSSTQVTAGRIRALLVALTYQDALLLKHFKDTGAIFDLVIRSPNAESLYTTQPIMLEYLRDRYGLEIIRQP